jgi:hypothetical protein
MPGKLKKHEIIIQLNELKKILHCKRIVLNFSSVHECVLPVLKNEVNGLYLAVKRITSLTWRILVIILGASMHRA